MRVKKMYHEHALETGNLSPQSLIVTGLLAQVTLQIRHLAHHMCLLGLRCLQPVVEESIAVIHVLRLHGQK